MPSSYFHNRSIDALRGDVMSLEDNGLSQASERLTNLQRALIDLLKMLDPEYLRFPEDRRSKSLTQNGSGTIVTD